MTASNEQNNALDTNFKVMKMCDLSDKEFKIVTLRKLNKLQENTGKPYRNLSENFDKEIEIIKTRNARYKKYNKKIKSSVESINKKKRSNKIKNQ